MKVIAFNGSPHEKGVVAAGIRIMAKELAAAGIETEVVHVGGQAVRGCTACGGCRAAGKCVIEGDIVNECSRKMHEADGVILGSPVYYGGVAGAFKCFLDRLFFQGTRLKYKVGASVVSLRRSGGIAVFHDLNNYFNLAGMIITPGVYWDVIHGNSPEELREDEEGVHIMEVQGRNMAWLLKALEEGKRAVPLPEQPPRKWTNFIH